VESPEDPDRSSRYATHCAEMCIHLPTRLCRGDTPAPIEFATWIQRDAQINVRRHGSQECAMRALLALDQGSADNDAFLTTTSGDCFFGGIEKVRAGLGLSTFGA
jgi:predicted DCC family thiol-disulfide oxidoreductase YuxK